MPDTPSTPCTCGQPVEAQYQRHATQAEYDAIPQGLKPIDGVALIAVKCCGDCLPPPCQHPAAEPATCPGCGAKPGQPCTGRNGGPRPVPHSARAAAQPHTETCRHAHRETCTDPGACQCNSDDPSPVRAPRVTLPPTVQAQAAALGFPPAMLPIAAQFLADHDIDPARIRGQVRAGFTQDNRPALLLDYATGVDDGHGHEVVELRIIPVDLP